MATHYLTFTYNGNGTNVSGVPSNSSSYYNNTSGEYPYRVTKALGRAPSRTYFTFNGWAVSSGASSGYAAGSSYPATFAAASEETKTIVFYATWAHVYASVKFNANGGTGAPADYTHWAGYSTTLPTQEPTRSGYNFLGWATSATATSAQYLPGGDYALYTDVTLYAVWSPATSVVNASNGTIGSAVPITITRYNSAYTHKLTYKFGSATGTIGTNVGTSINWTPPASLSAQFPNATSGTCVITCETYNGSTLIGTSTKSITLSIPSSVKCTISGVTLAETVSGLASKFGAFVQSKSKIKVTAAYDTSASSGATVASCTITINGQTLTANGAVTDAISNYGTLSYSVTIKDTRGRTDTYTGTYNVLQYTSPTITENAQRVESTPSSITVTYNFSVSPLSNKNDKTIKIYTKLQSESDYMYTLIDTITPSAYSGQGSYTITGTDEYATIDVKAELTDYFVTVSARTTVPASDNRVFDVDPITKTVSWHQSNPGDGNDHEFFPIVFHKPVTLGSTTLTEAGIEKLNGIGTEINAVPDAVSHATGVWKTLASVTLTKGIWIVTYAARWNTNANGRRKIVISKTQDSNSSYGMISDDTRDANADDVTFCKGVIVPNVSTTSTTYYLNGYQNSGSALTAYGRIYAFRIG